MCWDLEKSKSIPIYRASQDPSSSVLWSPLSSGGGGLLIVGTFYGYVRLFDLSSSGRYSVV